MALKLSAPFDPNERKDYTRDWTAEMNSLSDEIVDFAFVLPADALAAGLILDGSAIDAAHKKCVFWIKSNDPEATQELVGTDVRIDHTVETAGGRVFNETLILKVREK